MAIWLEWFTFKSNTLLNNDGHEREDPAVELGLLEYYQGISEII